MLDVKANIFSYIVINEFDFAFTSTYTQDTLCNIQLQYHIKSRFAGRGCTQNKWVMMKFYQLYDEIVDG